ncbi:MAG: hypothetical protein DCC67_14110 [Planctomycetota bacterium]|nr:MAG: hypothetical protein DCC67_14110 [Planctomycetota bacterium]
MGVLSGLVGSRLVRSQRAYASPGGSVAVGVLGALLGGLSRGRLLAGVHELPHADILAAGLGAAIALALWTAAQRACLSRPDSTQSEPTLNSNQPPLNERPERPSRPRIKPSPRNAPAAR